MLGRMASLMIILLLSLFSSLEGGPIGSYCREDPSRNYHIPCIENSNFKRSFPPLQTSYFHHSPQTKITRLNPEVIRPFIPAYPRPNYHSNIVRLNPTVISPGILTGYNRQSHFQNLNPIIHHTPNFRNPNSQYNFPRPQLPHFRYNNQPTKQRYILNDIYLPYQLFEIVEQPRYNTYTQRPYYTPTPRMYTIPIQLTTPTPFANLPNTTTTTTTTTTPNTTTTTTTTTTTPPPPPPPLTTTTTLPPPPPPSTTTTALPPPPPPSTTTTTLPPPPPPSTTTTTLPQPLLDSESIEDDILEEVEDE